MSNRQSRYDRDDYDEEFFDDRELDKRRGDLRRDELRRDDLAGRDPLRGVRASAQDAVRRANTRGRSRSSQPGFRLSNLANRPAILIAAIVAGLIVLGIVTYSLFSGPSEPDAPQTAQQQTSQQQPASRANPAAPETGAQPAPAATPQRDTGIVEELLGPSQSSAEPPAGSWIERVARVILRLALAALLAAVLAFRPRKDLPVLQRNPYVAQSQILLAVVAAALMMVVADNAARAFGIFAAASLVRFRTTLRDPKDITILLISLGIGLATGVGRLELAIVLALFVLLMLWVLEYYEPAQVFRALELTVKTRSVDDTDEMLRDLFEKYNINAEVREIDRQDEEDPVGKVVYYVNLTTAVSPDRLSDEIFTADPENVDSIQWDQKKSTSYIYR